MICLSLENSKSNILFLRWNSRVHAWPGATTLGIIISIIKIRITEIALALRADRFEMKQEFLGFKFYLFDWYLFDPLLWRRFCFNWRCSIPGDAASGFCRSVPTYRTEFHEWEWVERVKWIYDFEVSTFFLVLLFERELSVDTLRPIIYSDAISRCINFGSDQYTFHSRIK
jgi:hypothetical protein